MKVISFIGLGAMGLPMARNLLARGFSVRGYDVRNAAMNAFARAGGQKSHSVKEVLSASEMAILMVVNAQQAEQVLFSEGGLEAMAPNGIVIIMATCPPAAVEALANRIKESGRRVLDAPVSGGMVGAEAASLTVMASGARETFEDARPVFEALGNKVFHVGAEPGQGATVKTVNQLLCGVHIAVVAEAFSFAAKLGIDLNILLEILSGSSASSWMLKDRGPRMLLAEPDVTSAVDIFVKDLGIVLEAGRESKVAMPLSAIAYQMFATTSGRGDGAQDDSQVVRSYHLLNKA